MAKEIFMPKLSSTMEVGTLLQWFKEEGDSVEMGEPLFEIMTDKINIEVESYEEGVLLKKYFNVDDEVEVNACIGYIGEAGEKVSDTPPATEAEADSGEKVQDDSSVETAGKTVGANADSYENKDGKVRATPAARRVSRENDISLSAISGSGPNGRVHQHDVEQAIAGGVLAVTPLAEKIAADHGVDLSQITGTGARGKIEKQDVLSYLESVNMSDQETAAFPAERIKLKGLRKAVADKMVESVQTIPHVTLTSDVDMTNVIALRKSLLPIVEKETGYRLSFTEVIIKAAASALCKHPQLNASLIGEEIVMNKEVNIGLAVAVENGLIVPSIKNVNQKGLVKLTQISKELGKKARENKLKPEEMRGSTFTISNLGMYAIDAFTPIINGPETAILGVGRITEKAVAVDGELAVRPMMVLSLSFDHRAVDGAPAAAFLTDLKANLENPYSLLV
ncbi:dihydrolipoamide acetyltransferase family protein [Oceanobacillus neutriphilus]|uniref:Dihydrolipoamide acetyltransferase component of pyruvate dehydrogenase complex n=1 Tax=Oceanobacillus neutriphilus TaxID=531815 RepID=A0ABQ2NSH9_9BACI|nr:dihydrolipoamide acetyltransferase family protein [Oceanobacillus neutriphilus]GGP09289.1 dihydrolipoamide acetyltransferase component of pyruvate dehydrogenase complex [Oceanobacillus neutriphilus]